MANISSIALLPLFLLGGIANESHISLPMGAYLSRSAVPVYSGPPSRKQDFITNLAEDSGLVGVWKSEGTWFQITPPGFNPEGWVDGDYLRLDPALPVDINAVYLSTLQRVSREKAERTTPTACAVVLHNDTRYYSTPSLDASAGFSFQKYDEAAILTAFQQRNGFYEVQGDQSGKLSQWIQADSVDVSKPFSTPDTPCTHIFKVGEYRRYILTASSAYRKGPSAKLPPVAFYKKGEAIDVLGEYAGGWLTTIPGPMGAVWFPASDAVPADQIAQEQGRSSPATSYPMSGYTTATNVRLHAGPGADTAVVGYMAKANSYIALYEERNGWYRILVNDAPIVPWVSAQYVRQASDVELNLATAAYYMPPLSMPPTQVVPQNLPPQESKPLFTGPLRSLVVPWTWGTTFLLLLPFLLGFLSRLAFRDFDLNEAGDYAFWIVAAGTLIPFVVLALTSKGALAMAVALAAIGLPPALYPFHRLWAYIHAWMPSWNLNLKLRRRAMDDEKNDKIMKPELVPPVTKIESADIEKRAESSQPKVKLDIKPRPLSRIPLVNKLNLKTYKSQAETVRAVTDLVNANQELGEAAARFDRLNDTVAHKNEQEDAQHATIILEEEVKQARLRAERDAYSSGNLGGSSGRSHRSVEEELRATVAKETEAENAAMKILAEERQKCEEAVQRGEMKQEDVEHRLSVVRAKLDRYTARRQ